VVITCSPTEVKTNLQILLSQSDIIPLLKKIKKENKNSSTNLSLSKYIDNKAQKSQLSNSNNARMSNKNIDNENENIFYDSIDEEGNILFIY